MPTGRFELVTPMFTDGPPATGCTPTKFLAPSSIADEIVMVEDGDAVDVLKVGTPSPPGPIRTKPEGDNVTVPMAEPKPGAVAV